MPLKNYFEEEDENIMLLTDGRPQSTSVPNMGKKQVALLMSDFELPKNINDLQRFPKLVVVLVGLLLFSFWHFSSGHSGIHRIATPTHPHQLENGEELDWAMKTFGVFLEHAIPVFEKANFDCHNFLNMLPQGDCKQWVSVFSEQGTFSINVGQKQGEYKTRKELEDAFCHGFADSIKATKLVWHFPDAERVEGVALFEVFRRTRPGDPMEKVRWAQYAKFDTGMHIKEFRLYEESPVKDDGGNLIQKQTSAVVQANLKRLNRHDCGGFEAALPQGRETWIIQAPPDGTHKKDELDETPREKILQKCRKDIADEWSGLDFEHSYMEAQFNSVHSPQRSAIYFFHKERRWKGVIDVSDDPEALIVKLTETGAVHELHFYELEAVHLCKDWSWKYGHKKKR